ncbi:hypothetical protein M0Q28_04650 [Patescibacteria group bacterium]|nr:hypothetical protein [Patescibacteria group bacterium]
MHKDDSPFEILKKCGARKQGHFILSSWRHSDEYIDKREVSVIPRYASMLCMQVADRFRGKKIAVVAGPAVGAIVPSWETARLLTLYEDHDVKHVIPEKDETRGSKKFKLSGTHARHVKGQLVLVFEDIATTGDSVAGAVEAILEAGGIVEDVVFIWNRGGVTAEKLGVNSVFSLINERLQDWSEEEAPASLLQIPVHPELGRGAEYLRWTEAQSDVEMLLRSAAEKWPDPAIDRQVRDHLKLAREGKYYDHPTVQKLSSLCLAP